MTMKDIRFASGNEACTLGALRAGAKFYGGYPITPSSEVAESSAEELPKIGGRFIQMEDEIASMCSIIGASLAGAKSFTATSGPGFSLMQEALGYAVMTEVPLVVINVMRGGPSTGVPTGPAQGDIMQARWGTHGDHPIIVLYSSSVQETYEQTIRAFNLAEKYRQPVILLMDEILGHMYGSLHIPENIEVVSRRTIKVDPATYKPFEAINDIPQTANYGEGYRFHVTGLNHDETGFPVLESDVVKRGIDRIHRKIDNNLDDILAWEEIGTDDMDVLLVSLGTQAQAAKMAQKLLKQENIKAGLFRPITVWPFPGKRFSELSKKVKKIVVVEMNKGQIAEELLKYADCASEVVPLNEVNMKMISPYEIMKTVKEVM